MDTDNQNKFYTAISKYYSEIFSFQPLQLQFVTNETGQLKNKHILDIGCATGELAFNLAKEGAVVTGIDLNEDLLKQAVTGKTHSNLHFQLGNMLELERDFQSGQFDTVLCFGNTLVHLTEIELIQKMLKSVYHVLKPGGKFLMQILNYDYILNENVTKLPLIETENVKFTREYGIEEGKQIIQFKTNLKINKEQSDLKNETSLFALNSSDLINFLTLSGFTEINLYANFKKEPFGGNHLPLVVSCKKY